MALHSKELFVDFTTHTVNTLNVSQYDKDSRVFTVHILDNCVEVPLEENEKLIIKQSKPDGTFVINDCITNGDGTATLTLTDQMCAAHGVSNCQFTVTNTLNGTILHTMPFIIRIEKCVIDDSQIESTNEITTLNRLIIEAAIAAKNANDAADDLQHKLDTHHFVLTEDKDVAGGVPSLNSETKIPLAELYDATLSRKGIVQLTDSVSSTSTTTAAAPNSVKTTYDKVKAVEKEQNDNLNAEILRSKTAENDITNIINTRKDTWEKDTTYSIAVASNNTANGNAKLRLSGSDNSTKDITIKGTGSASVTTDSAGNVIVDSMPISRKLNNEDLNNLKDNSSMGLWYSDTTNTVTSKPDSIDAFGLIILRSADGYYTQLLFAGNGNTVTNNMYQRQYNGTSWSTWAQIITDNQLSLLFNANVTNTDWNTDKILDCNDAELGRMYTWNPSTLNIPLRHYGVLYTFGYNNDDNKNISWYHQMAWDNSSAPKIYTRIKINTDNWTPWVTVNPGVATTVNDGLLSKADKAKLDGLNTALSSKLSLSGGNMTGTLKTQPAFSKMNLTGGSTNPFQIMGTQENGAYMTFHKPNVYAVNMGLGADTNEVCVGGFAMGNVQYPIIHDGNLTTYVTPAKIGASPSAHTHNYAGSSSAGGAANTALACTGNSATATKATQDSTGQQINNTYIKGLSVNNKTITYTKGDNTTGTLTTQDTTYGIATGSTLGLVKSGTDITVDASGNVYVKDDSHSHAISNVGGLQGTLDGKSNTSHTHTELVSTVDSTKASSAANLYSKLATLKITGRYGCISKSYEAIITSHGRETTDSLHVNLWFKQQNSFGSTPYIYLSVTGNDSAIKQAQFCVVVDELNSAYTQISLYVKIVTPYAICSLFTVASYEELGSITYTNHSPLISALPSGTVINQVNINNQHSHSKSHIWDFPTSMPANGGNADSATKLATPRTINGVEFDGSKNISVPPVAKLLTNEDLNNFKDEPYIGYWYAMGGNTVKNKPASIDAFGLIVMRTANGLYAQILYCNSGGMIYKRQVDGNSLSWTSWNIIATDRNVDSYIYNLTSSGKNITFTRGDGSTGAITTQDTTYGIATGSTLGLVKSGGDINVDANGNVTVADDSHNHTVANVDGLQLSLDSKSNTNHSHSVVSQSANGLMSSALLQKLDSVATGANNYVHPSNHPASIITEDTTHRFITDNCKTIVDWDTVTTNGFYMAYRATNAPTLDWYYGWVIAHSNSHVYQEVYQFTLNAKMTPKYVRCKVNGVWKEWTNVTVGAEVPANAKFTDTIYTHPTTTGNKHIPSGGAAGQVLRWSSDGTAAWGTDNNNSYGIATGSTLGLVKSGTDITVDISGNVSVVDNSHNHTIANVSGLQSSLDAKSSTSHTHKYAGSSSAGGAATTALTCTGNSATATKATQDSDGNTISSTYFKKDMIYVQAATPSTTGLKAGALWIW